MISIDALYDLNPAVYAAFSEDRDFGSQSLGLADLVPEPLTALELFAGPAWHSHELARQTNARVLAVDSAPGMKQLAVSMKHVPEDCYVLSRLPSLGERTSQERFNLVTILRYSIGYLTPLEVEKLFYHLAALTTPGAVIAVELHDLALARSGFSNLRIRERTALTADGSTVRSAWPSAPPTWSRDEWQMKMPVTVTIEEREGQRRVLEYESTEFLYSRGEVRRAAERTSCFYEVKASARVSEIFGESEVLLLNRI